MFLVVASLYVCVCYAIGKWIGIFIECVCCAVGKGIGILIERVVL